MRLSDTEIERYARHLILREVGGVGQQRLKAARILIVGAGGLGTPLAQYLAASGIGTLGIVDDDTVSLSNLQRQVMHRTDAVGMAKVESAASALSAINPHVRVVPHRLRLTAATAMDLISAYDLVCDGSDNIATRYLLNDACHLAAKPLISGAILQFSGQLSTFKAHRGAPHPCYRCLFPEPPPADMVPSCAEAGVLGSLAGVIGSLQAVEAVKEVLGIGTSLSGRLMLYDALEASWRTIAVPRNPACPLCGDAPTIRDLSGHA